MDEQQGQSGSEQIIGRFGNYDLIQRIDIGGMGEVYLAHQRTAFGREVAVKIIRPDLAYDTTARKRFLREAEVSAHLKHEHILQLIEFSEYEGRLFLVTPYIKGGTLARRLREGALSLAEVRRLFSALVKAIAYIHKRGVVHRDLKPSNILLDKEDDSGEIYVRLIDFGIASIPGTGASAPLTTNGHELGTAAYMAPERLDGIAAPSNDIYSLGIILYQMLTGAVPHATRKIGSIPPALEAIVDRCTLYEPANRFADADELLKAFERACRQIAPYDRLEDAVAPTHPLEGEKASQPGPAEVMPMYTTSGRIAVVRPDGQPIQKGVFIHRAEFASSAAQSRLGSHTSPFKRDDYNAPTSYMNQNSLPAVRQKGQPVPPGGPARKRPGSPRRSLVTIVSLAIVVLILTISGCGYLLYTTSLTATVALTPRVQPISREFTITARAGQQSVDARTSLIPAFALTSKKTSSQEGETSNPLVCIPLLCKRTVTLGDLSRMADQMRPGLISQLKSDLSSQEQSNGYMPLGGPVFEDVDGTPSSSPDVGQESKTLTVTLTEQGSIAAIKSKDAHDLALILLRQALPENFALDDQSTQVSQPVLLSVSQTGDMKLAIAAGGVAHYQIPQTQLNDIQGHIRGMKIKDARAYLATQPGLDGNNTTVHLSYGDTLPNNPDQIKLVTVNPTNMPPVRLPTLPATTPTITRD